jgi:CRISPR-associated protein Csx10
VIGFTYTLILKEPVLANSLSGDTNSARSLSFIPGGLVRGALIQNYGGIKQADDADFQRLFLNGKTRFLHAYPVCGGKRMLPTPLAWKTYKDDPNHKRGIVNFSKAVISDPKVKKAPFPFYSVKDDVVIKVKQQWQVNVHTQRDAVFGRAKGQGKGTVFRYEALPAGLHLQGVILADNEDDVTKIKELLQGSILLGKARTAGYGQAEVKVGENLSPGWREDEYSEAPAGRVNEFQVTFLSDAILRDENGQLTLDLLPALKAKLKVEDLEVKNTFCQMEIVGGFNRQWGLPLPQSQAVAAGSVFVLTSASGVEETALRKIEMRGMGERTSEGFGRLSIGVNPKDGFELRNGEVTFEVRQSGDMSASEALVADLMLKRLLRRELDERVLGAVIEATKVYKGGVKNSQLSRWRVYLRGAIGSPENGLAKIREFYNKEDERNTPSWQKMTRAKVRIKQKESENGRNVVKLVEKRLTEWMESLIEEKADVWLMLGYDGSQQPMKTIGSQTYDANKELRVDYSLRLMDAVLASMTKKNTEGGRDGS